MRDDGNLGERLDTLRFKETTRTEQMEAYDKLPLSVRNAIEDLPLKIDVVGILQAFEEDGERNTLANLALNKRIMMKAIQNEKLSLLPKTDRKEKSDKGP